jgi:hypothetical protein
MNQTCPNQPLFACNFIFFSKSIHVCCLRNSSSQTFFIGHKVLEVFESCGISNFVVVVTSISNLIVCKHAQSTFGCLNGVQSNNTTCIFLLYKIVVMCINILHDLEEQRVMHLILLTKR